MATNFGVKIGKKSDNSPLCVAMAFQNRLQYRHSEFKMFICDHLAKLYKHLGELRSSNSEV